MSEGKQFKRKMKHTRAGHSYWRTHGLPLPIDVIGDEKAIAEYCGRSGKPFVVVKDYYFYAERCVAVGKMGRYQPKRNGTPPTCLKDGTLTKYFKKRMSAEAFLLEIKSGFHNKIIHCLTDFHTRLDAFDDFMFDNLRTTFKEALSVTPVFSSYFARMAS